MSFDISRLRRADRIIGIGAIALFVFMFFFKWYGGSSSASIGGVSFSASANGWHTFTNSRWIWIITIIVALGSVVLVASQRKLELPVQASVLVAGLGALSTIFILYRIVHHPSGGTSGSIAGVHYSSSYGIKIGIWLGLIAAALITYGGYLAMQDEGTSLADVREQASGAFSGLAADRTAGAAGAGEPTPAVPAPPVATPMPPSATATSAPPATATSAPPATAPSAPPTTAPSAPPIPPPAEPPGADTAGEPPQL